MEVKKDTKKYRHSLTLVSSKTGDEIFYTSLPSNNATPTQTEIEIMEDAIESLVSEEYSINNN